MERPSSPLTKKLRRLLNGLVIFAPGRTRTSRAVGLCVVLFGEAAVEFPAPGLSIANYEPPAPPSVCSWWTTAFGRATAVLGILSTHTEAAWAGLHAPGTEPFFRPGLARHERSAQ